MPSPYLPDVTIYCGRVDTLKKRIKKLDEELGRFAGREVECE
jgi:hypothetical protein